MVNVFWMNGFKLGEIMDKKIKKVKKNIDHAEKDTKKLLKMDVKNDKKIKAYDKMKKKRC